MRVLILGAGGFVGSALCQVFFRHGHDVIAGIRHRRPADLPTSAKTIAIDYTHDIDPTHWVPRLDGIDVVINAVGILKESARYPFSLIHERAPQALFRACELAGVQRVIQISALGADADAKSGYHLSKRAADDALRASSLNWTIVQPSLVFGPQGPSTQMLLTIASLPVIALPGRGDQPLQPIHADDLATLVLHLATERAGIRETVEAVGPHALNYREMLATYRHAMGGDSPLFFPIPISLVRLSGSIGDVLGHPVLGRQSIDMLERGNTGSPASMARILRRAPRSPSEFIPPGDAATTREAATRRWLRPTAQLCLAAMWIAAGIVTPLFARENALALLGQLGLPGTVGALALACACALNVFLGIASVRWPGRHLWLAQLAVMIFYTLALSWVAPALWADPFGPLVKNLPVAALLLWLLSTEARDASWTTR